MDKIIFYFTGTGNSLDFAMRLSERIHATLVGIPSVVNNEAEAIPCDTQTVGVVFPTYMYRPPRLVAAFLERIRNPEYLFLIAVNGGDAGDVLRHAGRALAVGNVRADAGFEVRLPDNYLPFGPPPSEEKQADIFRNAEGKLSQIEQIVTAKERFYEPNKHRFARVFCLIHYHHQIYTFSSPY